MIARREVTGRTATRRTATRRTATRRTELLAAAIAGICGLGLAACAEIPATAAGEDVRPAVVETVGGSAVSRITLTAEAAERIDLTTAPVTEELVAPSDGTAAQVRRKTIPYGALIYDSAGVAWAYTSLEPRVFMRAQLSVDYISGDTVVLVEGPETGTHVVTVGAAELYGAELGLGQ
jgi:hypothetical protein